MRSRATEQSSLIIQLLEPGLRTRFLYLHANVTFVHSFRDVDFWFSLELEVMSIFSNFIAYFTPF